MFPRRQLLLFIDLNSLQLEPIQITLRLPWPFNENTLLIQGEPEVILSFVREQNILSTSLRDTEQPPALLITSSCLLGAPRQCSTKTCKVLPHD